MSGAFCLRQRREHSNERAKTGLADCAQSKLPINLKLESSCIMATDQFAVSDQAATFDENRLKEQKEKVRRFRKRLQAREAFILPEIWDVAPTQIVPKQVAPPWPASATSIRPW